LKEFYAERDARAEQFLKLQAEADRLKALEPVGPLSMEAFTEDWNESQFWVCFPAFSFVVFQDLSLGNLA